MCAIILKAFREITGFDEKKPILSILKESDKYFAHTQKDKAKETLEEHLKLVVEYFLKLVDAHNLDLVVNNLIIKSLPNTFSDKSKIGNYIKESFYKTIFYHDFGKINHKFQKDKMDNPRKDFKIVNHKVDSQHSIISAYIYLIHELDNENLMLSDSEQTYLDAIISTFAYPILRHHSKSLNSVMDTDFQKNENYFSEYLDIFDKRNPSDINLLHGIITDFDTTFKLFDKLEVNLFSIFSLIKLNFSLITTPDYYATGEYMQNLKVDSFGLIEGEFRKRIIDSFKTTKIYNQQLFERTETLNNIPFENVKERCGDNLNLLRQKIAAEALVNIKLFKTDNLFYLEAPTGSGKTNISLALMVKLLEGNKNLNKVFYVFPFTTLITQTFKAVKETLEIDNEHIIQLHSKSGFHQQNEESNDGNYGSSRLNFLNNHFVNYPITLLTHIKLFDILKGNNKDTNYIFHRLANSIVIIDELQSYNPKHWDKIIYFLSNYAELFNMKIILMSATLPKIDDLLTDSSMKNKVKHLVSKENKPKYFQNKNFAGRVEFDFSILDKCDWKRPKSEERNDFLKFLAQKIHSESEYYAKQNILKPKSVRTLVEFITKKSASTFLKLLKENEDFKSYKMYLISGEILNPRRNQIIEAIKSNVDDKVILITTQVIEAGVDIDMDLGFKDRSLIDSDEQLAGRVNRNAEKENCKVFMFDFDSTSFIYKNDKRLDVEVMNQKNKEDYKKILETKDFDTDFYYQVQLGIKEINESKSILNLSDYLENFSRFNFFEIDKKFKLIEQENESVYVPLSIPKHHFSFEDLKIIEYFDIPEKTENNVTFISGMDVWESYVSIVTKNDKDSYFENQSKLKQIYGVLSKFMFSAFSNQIEQLKEFSDYNEAFSSYKQYGIYYLSGWKDIYNYENGIDVYKLKKGDVFL